MPYWHHEPLVHRPVGDKLAGVVLYGCGKESGPGVDWLDLRLPRIFITNPNCTASIFITQMSIIQQDMGGTKLIYEGPFLATPLPEQRVPVDLLVPHASAGFQLRWCIPVGFNSSLPTTAYGFPDPNKEEHWLKGADVVNQHPALYAVEIEWWAAEQGAQPLIGFKQEESLRWTPDFATLLGTSMSETQMVNLKRNKD